MCTEFVFSYQYNNIVVLEVFVCTLQDINFWGNVYPTYVALPYLHHSNGRIIVNASVDNWLPLPRMSLYAVSRTMNFDLFEFLSLSFQVFF